MNKIPINDFNRFPSKLDSKALEWEELENACGEDLPNVFSLISLIRALPPTSVRNEATFSTMKLTKGKRRARLNNETLNDHLMVNLESLVEHCSMTLKKLLPNGW
jgi:hypothetical protein